MEPHTETTPATLHDVRIAILRQHTRIEQLIDELEAQATAVLAGGEHVAALNEAVALFKTRFERHLEYEEANIPKWLPPPQPGVVHSLLADHADQRLRIRELLHDRDVFGDPRSFAREVVTFVHCMRKDMAAEDDELRHLR